MLTIDQPSTNLDQDTQREQRKKELETQTAVATDFLMVMDGFADNIGIDQQSGKIQAHKQQIELEDGPTKEYMQRYTDLRAEFQTANEQLVAELKALPEVLDAQIVGGAVVVTIDSSIGKFKYSQQTTQADVTAEYFPARKDKFLGLVIVDLNKNKTRGRDTASSLAHELHHHTLAVTDYLFATDPKVKMMTGVRKMEMSALYGKGFSNFPDSGYISKKALNIDAESQSLLLGREYQDAEMGNVENQLAYLDELHSSFLQKKPEWFAANNKVYGNLAGTGFHWEIVGNNLDDQAATYRMLGILQALYILDQGIIAGAGEAQVKFPERKDIAELVTSFNTLFKKVGAIIGASRGVQQCEQKVKDEWDTFRLKNSGLLEKNKANLEAQVVQWEQKKWAADSLREMLTSYF